MARTLAIWTSTTGMGTYGGRSCSSGRPGSSPLSGRERSSREGGRRRCDLHGTSRARGGKLAADAVLASGAVASADRRTAVEQVVSSAAESRAALTAAADVEREIANRALEWTRVDADLLQLPDLDTAREAALAVRIDGRSLAEVARDCGVQLERRTLYVEEAEQERLTELLGANAGELVGPVAREAGFLLVHVVERTRPRADDPALRSRAADYLVQRAIERELETRVRWA